MSKWTDRNILLLPSDWWQRESASLVLSDLFAQSILSLFLSVKIGDQYKQYLYTGFPLLYQSQLIWVTAGHVVKNIEEVLASDHKINLIKWADSCNISGAETVPVTRKNLNFYNVSKFDIGFALVDGLDALAIQHNDRSKILNERMWRSLHTSDPEGYFLVGYPQEFGEIIETPVSYQRSDFSFKIDLACLPAERIDYRPESQVSDFWNDPNAFYAKILPYSDVDGNQPESVVGMSGAPLLAVERDLQGRIRYQLIGVQSSWKKDERLIRVEPIWRLVEAIDVVVSNE